jgi:hypothetical protein
MSQAGISTKVQPSGGVSVGSATIRFITTLFWSITAQVVIKTSLKLELVFIVNYWSTKKDLSVLFASSHP